MLRVALTGGIASGKSYALARFASLGAPTVDADELVHEALAAGSPAVGRIAGRFGRPLVLPDGSVDRKALGALVFRNARARADLEAILHPEVFRRIDEWFSALPEFAFAIADIPLLFETHHEGLFDRIVVTHCEPEQQVERLMKRNELSEAEARARIAAQWPIDDKVRLAHYIVETGGTFEETDRDIQRVFEALNEDARL